MICQKDKIRGDNKHTGVYIVPFNTEYTVSEQVDNYVKQQYRKVSFNEFNEQSIMVDLIENPFDRTRYILTH